MKIKDIIKNILPDTIVSLIREHNDWSTYKKYKKNIKKITQEKDKIVHDKIKMAFIVEYPEVWNSVRTVYEETQNGDIDAIIICIPKSKPQTEDYILNENKENEAYEYLINQGIRVYNAFQDGKWFDLKNFRPDYVFYTRPYNSEYPLPYKTSVVSGYAKICYIPYAFSQTTGFLLDMTFNWDFMLNTYVTFAPSKIRLEECKKRFAWQIFRKTNYYEYLGFPRFDLLKDFSNKRQNRWKILWLPRWFVKEGDGNKKSHFLEFLPGILSFATKYPEVNLVIRPHPLMFQTMVEKKIKSREEVEKIKKSIDDIPNVYLDSNKDYLPALESADVLIADFTSLLAEYFVTGRPIIYCDDSTDFNDDAKLMNSTYYHANEWEEIEKILIELHGGKDDKKNLRNKTIESIMPANAGKIGKEIIKYLIYDYNK